MRQKRIIIILLVSIFFVMGAIVPYLASPAWAQSDNDAQEESHPEKQEGKGIIDTSHETISKGILITAKWLDSFFSNEQYEEEENRSSLRLQSTVFQEEEENAQFGAKARLRIVLPKTEDKLQLVFSGEADDEPDSDSTSEQTVKQSPEATTLKQGRPIV